jgi:hypothetical protein
VDGEGVSQLIGKMDSREGRQLIQGGSPMRLVCELAKLFLLPGLEDILALDQFIPHRGKEIRHLCPAHVEHIGRQRSIVGALLDNRERRRAAKVLPHLLELNGKQPSVHRPDAYVREKIASAPQLGASGAVIPVLRVIERQFHEIPESHPAAPGDQGLYGIGFRAHPVKAPKPVAQSHGSSQPVVCQLAVKLPRGAGQNNV